MSLPKIEVQTKKLKSKDGKTEYLLRPFSDREQKILLATKESMKAEENGRKRLSILLHGLEQVLNNCILSHDIDDVMAYDFQFIMLELRKMSVDNISTITFQCKSKKDDGEECGREFSINVDLDKVKTKGEVASKKDDFIADLDSTFSIFLKYPTFKEFKTIYEDEMDDVAGMRMFMDFVFERGGDGVYPISESTDEELEDFITDMGPRVRIVQEWVENMPRPYFKTSHKCKGCGNTKTIELKELDDFF